MTRSSPDIEMTRSSPDNEMTSIVENRRNCGSGGPGLDGVKGGCRKGYQQTRQLFYDNFAKNPTPHPHLKSMPVHVTLFCHHIFTSYFQQNLLSPLNIYFLETM